MEKQDTHERIRRAGELLAMQEGSPGDSTLLFQAWESLKGLHCDDLPPDIRPAFNFLEHEISRAQHEDLSAREVAFLTEKIRKLESMWIELAAQAVDSTA